jgi:hypothetical protein
MKLLWIFLFSFLYMGLSARPNDKGHTYRYILGLSGGTIWGHNAPVYHLAHSHPLYYWAEFQIQKPSKEWSRAWNHPIWGFGISVLDFRSPVLGKSVLAITYLEPRLWKSFTYRIGTGCSFQTHPFNSDGNSTNLMLGSHFAMVMHAQLNWYLALGPKTGLRLGWGITHLSNGAFAQPNSGVNSFFLSAGLSLKNQAKPFPAGDSVASPAFRKGFSVLLSSSIALVEKFPVSGPKYPVFQIHGRFQYRPGRKSTLSIGLDWKKNTTVAALIEDNPELGSSSSVLGLPLGHELHISSVSLITEMGFYILKHHDVFPDLYQRYGLRKYWSENCFTAIYLSTHRAKAECLEWTVGYKWSKKP